MSRGTRDVPDGLQSFAYRAFTFCGPAFQRRSATPPARLALPSSGSALPQPPSCNGDGLSHMMGLGYSPFARRYSGNRSCFLFLGVLRCFSSPGIASHAYGFSMGYRGFSHGGFPHSGTPGSTLACSSPGRFAACRALRRPLAPRHPPCALSSLTKSLKDAPHTHCAIFKVQYFGGLRWTRTTDLTLIRRVLSPSEL